MTIRIWLLAFILLIAAVIQLAQWKNTRRANAKNNPTNVERHQTEYQQWHKRVKAAQAKRQQLETQLLWDTPDPLLPALSKAAEALEVKLIGVETQPQRHRNNYQFHPVSITVSGDYNRCSELLAVVEQISPTIRIDQVWLRMKKRTKDNQLLMTLTLTPISKTNTRTSTEIHTHPIERFTITRNPFLVENLPETQPVGDTDRYPPVRNTNISLQLTTILFDESKPLAILNSNGTLHTVEVGDEINDVSITQIHPHHVTVKRGSIQHTLSLWTTEGHNNHPTPKVVFTNR